ncbi:MULTISPECIES: DNA polymerase/3'-5' exonuclease PolX [Acidobacterium]|uniref:DNA polymerase beta n=1 Tax=Acidobacterium capsulatum (strain ATCC 51196 / DSM 11244 / BCRC 80197 / JCM 7670 / NBRC 15755 / NCIMB 13165 / 161) TaxID=240015 RepID=C1F770_ACIC5|nr:MULTISPECIES: DNA polymerase/3'-5' exonuclease PolX [Acidobacterium]ACO33728.1 PHP domain protein [Acidobacterium capsulatum ATCC 51196]HCT61005.1 DNA polymerase/3'-5' exonuclease PolX [Acidobacterium sp.]
MDNRSIAHLLDETADLLEIDSGDSFRIRSYRRAAEAVEATTVTLATIAGDAKKLQEIPGIGKGMAANIAQIEETGSFDLRRELLEKYNASILELLKLPGMGPKTVALLFSALKVDSIETLEAALKAGKLNGLPRFGKKLIDNIKKGIEEYRQHHGRFLVSVSQRAADEIAEYLRKLEGIETVTPAGSTRRGRETAGDLDLLVTGPACAEDVCAEAVEYTASYPGIDSMIARGQNKVSFKLHNGLQVDVRLLPEESYGAALQYFTGSKMHNVTLRQRALRRGYTLSEYALANVADGSVVAARTEEEIYAALDLDWIPPELRENNGEIEAAENHTLPDLIELKDIHGDVHMHTDATDGRNTIREMAEAALERGYQYIAITDHSKNLAMTNGLDDQRALEHIRRIREVDEEMEGRIRVFPGIEVDILGDGALDLADETLAQMDVVIASVHTLFQQPREQMTERVLRALENPYVRILGHPTGRLLLRREPFEMDLRAVLEACARLGVAVEHNSSPERLDLCDRDLRLARELGCKIVINTDAHHTSHLANIRFGLRQLRRAWLTRKEVLNHHTAEAFLKAMRPRP